MMIVKIMVEIKMTLETKITPEALETKTVLIPPKSNLN